MKIKTTNRAAMIEKSYTSIINGGSVTMATGDHADFSKLMIEEMEKRGHEEKIDDQPILCRDNGDGTFTASQSTEDMVARDSKGAYETLNEGRRLLMPEYHIQGFTISMSAYLEEIGVGFDDFFDLIGRRDEGDGMVSLLKDSVNTENKQTK